MGIKLNRMSVADLFLVHEIILNYMKENNITDIDLVDENAIQEKYDLVMNKVEHDKHNT